MSGTPLLAYNSRRHVSPAAVDAAQVLSEAFKDSDPVTPIYFILSPGANVTADVDKLADKHSMERGATYHDISLGQVKHAVETRKHGFR